MKELHEDIDLSAWRGGSNEQIEHIGFAAWERAARPQLHIEAQSYNRRESSPSTEMMNVWRFVVKSETGKTVLLYGRSLQDIVCDYSDPSMVIAQLARRFSAIEPGGR